MKTNKHISLNEIGKEVPFSVPENYFNHFTQQIEEQIGIHTPPAHKLLRPWMYIAAMFVVALMLGQLGYRLYQNNSTQNSENYELYVLSQVDETALMDCYVDESVK